MSSRPKMVKFEISHFLVSSSSWSLAVAFISKNKLCFMFLTFPGRPGYLLVTQLPLCVENRLGKDQKNVLIFSVSVPSLFSTHKRSHPISSGLFLELVSSFKKSSRLNANLTDYTLLFSLSFLAVLGFFFGVF